MAKLMLLSTHTMSVKKYVTHIVRLSGQRREAGDSRADPKWLG